MASLMRYLKMFIIFQCSFFHLLGVLHLHVSFYNVTCIEYLLRTFLCGIFSASLVNSESLIELELFLTSCEVGNSHCYNFHRI